MGPTNITPREWGYRGLTMSYSKGVNGQYTYMRVPNGITGGLTHAVDMYMYIQLKSSYMMCV